MWQPTASIATLKQRAAILAQIRAFFAARNVLEVETPALCRYTVTDPYIDSIPARMSIQHQEHTYYLQTSPEYAMKRLLAAGSGAIYQLAKAFRQDQSGRLHNPEFTMLEWYQPGYDHHDLMHEVDELLQCILQTMPAEKLSYAQIFKSHLNIDPHLASPAELTECVDQNGIELASNIINMTDQNTADTLLQQLFSHCIEPRLGQNKPCFIYDFPASQAALAKLNAGEPPLAARFEVYIKGIELANGFHELQDAKDQRKRFENNNITRKTQGLTAIEIDEDFLSALSYGLPDCAGVALGVDRLVMLATNNQKVSDVLSFDSYNAHKREAP